MAYPNMLYKGQYTLKRVLTMPSDVAVTADHIGMLVTLNAAGDVIVCTGDELFYGVLRTVNVNDNVCTVDFSGVHEFTASGTIVPGGLLVPATGSTIKVDGVGVLATATTKVVALTAAADTELVQVMFLN